MTMPTFHGLLPDGTLPTVAAADVQAMINATPAPALDDLADVDTTAATTGQVLTKTATGWDAQAAPNPYELRGTGSPEAVVTASPGVYYTDSAGTTGAWRWLKKSGTGNTGWKPIESDTDWVNVSSKLINGWTGTSLLRREGTRVYWRVHGLSGAAATGTVTMLDVPGFSPTTVGSAAVRPVFHQADGAATLKRFAGHTFQHAVPQSSALYGEASWDTADPWPTTLTP